MPRWEPDARARLVVAALHLFTEQGYDETTVTQIAERAGLTKSTFFRHFPDKREVLAAGQETLSGLFAEGIADAPEGATALDAVGAGLDRACSTMTSFNRELGSRMSAAIAANAELRERHRLKQVGMAAAMADALRARGVPQAVAALAAEMGVLAFSEAFTAWVAADEAPDDGTDRTGGTGGTGGTGDAGDGDGEGMVALARAALDRLRGALAELG
ncbi:transcriptional regulator, TetR family [Actinacidiphila alni]|uniref:Transcriptional regulator, TetR family n=1 Tax=Actinacidiphila alni TaxID=380248 RepID=A0A1I2IP48_9ACTN|nr:TetR/AcrR family transcriptional regulator [Actinacidiphila alni]SFF44065.1 transcriptional regulator, TetR family [Actinacidiphila alni]